MRFRRFILIHRKDPQATLDGWDGDGWNGWHGAPYVYPEYYHPTAWVGREAIKFIKSQVGAAKPFLAKVSFHRPHSPYDPPQRVLSKFDAATFPPIHVSDPAGKDPWDLRFRGQEGDPPGCGPSNADAWPVTTPSHSFLFWVNSRPLMGCTDPPTRLGWSMTQR